MGDSQSKQISKDFTQLIQLVQIYQDRNFGPVQIFRYQEPPFEYIMKLKKNYIEGDNRLTSYFKLIQELKKIQHKNISKIHQYELKQENQMCIKDRKINIYCNYYNFTLTEAIEKKKSLNLRFPESELIYILGCLLDISLYLRQSNISLGDYRCDNIYLSPEGHLKIYLLGIEDSNKHNAYYRGLTEKNTIKSLILSPQQLKLMSQMQYDIKFNIQKADVFAIGMIIFQLLTLDNAKFYYNDNFQSWNFSRIMFNLSQMSNIYNEKLLSIVRNCLEQSHEKRCTIDQGIKQLEWIKSCVKSVSHCIRLHDDQQKCQKMKIKPENQVIKLNVKTDKKLTPSPITTLYSSFKNNQQNKPKLSAKLTKYP